MSLQERLNGSESLDDPLALQGRIGLLGADRPIDRFADLRASLHNACIAKVGPELIGSETDPEALRTRVREVVSEELGRHAERLTADERTQLVADVVDEVLGYGPIDRFVRDRSVTEIMVNGPDQIFVERDGRLEHDGRPVRRRRAPAARSSTSIVSRGRPPRSTRRRRWSTPGCPTARASTRSSRRSRSAARC